MVNINKALDVAHLAANTIKHLKDIEKSEVLNGAIQVASMVADKGNEFLDKLEPELESKLKSKFLSVEELLDNYSPIIDEKIIEYAKSTQETPIGGEFGLQVNSDEDVLLTWEFYFTDSQNKYKKIGSEKAIQKSLLADEVYAQIKANSPKFTIDPPKF